MTSLGRRSSCVVALFVLMLTTDLDYCDLPICLFPLALPSIAVIGLFLIPVSSLLLNRAVNTITFSFGSTSLFLISRPCGIKNTDLFFKPFVIRLSKFKRKKSCYRVMGAVQRAIFRLQEPEKLHVFLCELGRKHDKNGAKLEYIDVSYSQTPLLFLPNSLLNG